MQEMYDEARRDLITSQEARISTEEEAIVREKIRETREPEMRQQIQSKLDEEMRAGAGPQNRKGTATIPYKWIHNTLQVERL